jgi:predicted HicB family RNase H-like nuclease
VQDLETVGVGVPPDLKDWLRIAAARGRISLSEYVRGLIEAAREAEAKNG